MPIAREDIEPYVSIAQAAEFLGKSPAWLRRYQADLGIPRTKLGRQYRYRLSAVAAWLDDQSTAGE